jgi:hypothetical protein
VIGAQAAGAASPEQVRAAVDQVLAGPEFQATEGLLDRFSAWLAELLRSLLPHGVGVEAGVVALLLQALVWILFAAVLVALALSLVRRARGRAGSAAPAAADPQAERRARVAGLRAAARAALARGDHRLALRLEFTALVVGLGQKGDLEYREAYTNRELVARGHPGPEAERVLRPLVPELDRKSFGGEPAGPQDVERMAQLCDRLLGRAGA